jgi:hypothetical protein
MLYLHTKKCVHMKNYHPHKINHVYNTTSIHKLKNNRTAALVQIWTKKAKEYYYISSSTSFHIYLLLRKPRSVTGYYVKSTSFAISLNECQIAAWVKSTSTVLSNTPWQKTLQALGEKFAPSPQEKQAFQQLRKSNVIATCVCGQYIWSTTSHPLCFSPSLPCSSLSKLENVAMLQISTPCSY